MSRRDRIIACEYYSPMVFHCRVTRAKSHCWIASIIDMKGNLLQQDVGPDNRVVYYRILLACLDSTRIVSNCFSLLFLRERSLDSEFLFESIVHYAWNMVHLVHYRVYREFVPLVTALLWSV